MLLRGALDAHIRTATEFARKIAAVTLLVLSGCVSDDQRCDENQVLVKAPRGVEQCACVPGAVMSSAGYGCTPCGSHEEAKDNQCVCTSGYSRLTATSPCEPATGQEIGAECTNDESCSQPYPYCATADSDPYCTKQDCNSGDCPPGYSCERANGSSYCAKLPTGIGMSCTATGGECSAYDADFCESFMTQRCFIEGCATGKNQCPGEYGCCDLSALAGSALSLCFAPAQLVDSECPAGTLVTP